MPPASFPTFSPVAVPCSHSRNFAWSDFIIPSISATSLPQDDSQWAATTRKMALPGLSRGAHCPRKDLTHHSLEMYQGFIFLPLKHRPWQLSPAPWERRAASVSRELLGDRHLSLLPLLYLVGPFPHQVLHTAPQAGQACPTIKTHWLPSLSQRIKTEPCPRANPREESTA